MKLLLQRAEYLLLRGVLCAIRRIPAHTASNLGGFLARSIGPILPVSRIADRNLQLAFPTMPPLTRRKTVRDCWDNIGRTVAELPHIGALKPNTPAGPGWSIEGIEHLQTARESGRPIIFFSGHIGNWELMPLAAAHEGLTLASFYRAASNPHVDQLIRDLRQSTTKQEALMFPKGAKGARSALRHLAKGGHLGILGDQKMNDGIEVSLFGRPAMTASAAAVFALRHQAVIVTLHVRRDGPARLAIVVDEPFTPETTDDHQYDVHALTQRLNHRLEDWIRAKPGAWLWLHRRWDKALYRQGVAPP